MKSSTARSRKTSARKAKRPLFSGLTKAIIAVAIPIVLISLYIGNRSVSLPNDNLPAATIASQPGHPFDITLAVVPATVRQGDPAEVIVTGLDATSTVKSLVFDGNPIDVFLYHDEVRALIGLDLRAKTGPHTLVLTLASGRQIMKTFTVSRRPIAVEKLGIPAKLGGNTPAGVANLLTSLATENLILDSLPTAPVALWKGKFGWPVESPKVTDQYGFTRITYSGTSIAHKGTDFHAPPGTSVLAMNAGIVRIARNFPAYGDTIVIDHGLGVQTLYLHLSKFDVKEGDTVARGQVIGQSGETGYSEGPHLHLSVKIGSVSIDPMKFLQLF